MRTANFSGRSVADCSGLSTPCRIIEKLKPFSYSVLKDECLDLPKKTFMKRIVSAYTMSKVKIYKQMKH